MSLHLHGHVQLPENQKQGGFSADVAKQRLKAVRAAGDAEEDHCNELKRSKQAG